MYPSVDTKNPAAVQGAVLAIYRELFPSASPDFVPRVFGWAIDCFTGNHRDYQAIDARYHDFEHTLQVTLCMARLLQGRHEAEVQPILTQRMFELGLLAILLHDTGYLKKHGDNEGTGAKYTMIHVARSADFARELLQEKGFTETEINSIGNMIRCTGVNADLESIPFQADWERVAGAALATADLLGQMAADDYVEKLPILFEEFAESARYQTGDPKATGIFASALDLLQKTPTFWEKYVVPKINKDFQGLYQYLNHPYPSGGNYYLDRVTANIELLRERFC